MTKREISMKTHWEKPLLVKIARLNAVAGSGGSVRQVNQGGPNTFS